MDLVMRPQMVHDIMNRLTEAYLCKLDQYIELNVLSMNNDNHRVGSGGYGYSDELPAKDFDGEHWVCFECGDPLVEKEPTMPEKLFAIVDDGEMFGDSSFYCPTSHVPYFNDMNIDDVREALMKRFAELFPAQWCPLDSAELAQKIGMHTNNPETVQRNKEGESGFPATTVPFTNH